MDLLLAAALARLGADEMTVENEVFDPDRYRKARELNHSGRAALFASAGFPPGHLAASALR